MSSLYIGGAQCVHADFLNSEDWMQFDKQEQSVTKLAEKFNLAISRYSLNQENYSFVVMNKKVEHKCFYSGAAFEVDMSIEISDTFEFRFIFFMEALNSEKRFKTFHNLKWSKPKVLYFAFS